MKNRIDKLLAIAIILAILLGFSACVTNFSPSSSPTTSTPSPTSPAGLEKIQHFVFIMQENRSFDSYFGTYPGANGIPAGISFVDLMTVQRSLFVTIPTSLTLVGLMIGIMHKQILIMVRWTKEG